MSSLALDISAMHFGVWHAVVCVIAWEESAGMGHCLLNTLRHNWSGKNGRSQQQAEQSNIFKTVNTLYDRCSVNVLSITVIKMAFINLSKRYRTSASFHTVLVNILKCEYYWLNIRLMDSKGKHSKWAANNSCNSKFRTILTSGNLVSEFYTEGFWFKSRQRSGRSRTTSLSAIFCHPRQIQEYFLSIMYDHFLKTSFWFINSALCLQSKILTAPLNRS